MEGAVEELCEEATCSICLEYFIDPVTIDCGHNFCQACFDQLWEDPNVDSSCPQCRERIKQRNFRPNRQLANIAEIVKNFQERKGLKRKWEEPQRQQEPPKFSWRDDQAPVGAVWDSLHAHQGNAASSISKISVKYKAQLEAEKQKIRSAFQRMQVFLRAKQRLWLGELGDLEKKVWKRGEGNFAELSGELSRLRNLIVAMEARNLQPSYDAFQPAKESLQDIRRALMRCEKNASEHESDLSHWWGETLKIAAEKSSALEKATENYKAPLMQDLNKVNVTLDPNTAHPCLTVSEDLKSFFAFTCPAPTPLDLARDPQKIRVSLDYERGQVQFSDADTGDLIFTYHAGPFSGERLRPFFQREAAMATGGPTTTTTTSFYDEATCPVCLDYFKDPVTVDCGHNFCQACITQYLEQSEADPSCPQCTEKVKPNNFSANRQLANLVVLVKKVQGERQVKGKGGVCKNHGEPLKLFCTDDEVPICVVCDRSNLHRGHRVFPAEEASHQYKERIGVHVKSLKQERKRLVDQKLAKEQKKQKCLKQLETEKQNIMSAFEKMHEFLIQKQDLWLDHFEDLTKELERKQDENLARVSEEISRLSGLIAEMGGKCRQPPSEFLQDVSNTISRCEENLVEPVVDLHSWLEAHFRIAVQKNTALEEAMENYKDTLERALDANNLEQAVNTVNVVLDPNTAHPYLILSADLKSVRWEPSWKEREWRKKNVSQHSARFDWEVCVLGRNQFISGTQWWTVEVLGEGSWTLGVARDSVVRKGCFNVCPDEGIWALRKPFRETYLPREVLALTSPETTPLMLTKEPKRILVALDYPLGWVGFFDADTDEFIFSFHSGSFAGERIRPFFQLRERGFSLKC
ncbi:zinc finger protein RFP-like [Lacerta agilis]|uniref:zinc finger protein RFP-like n=1 Tax=Lacerta agilis TaxID=80427 RepID=UPI001419D883|nr:zinc finger protein RFP-like [Lacerta agilis]